MTPNTKKTIFFTTLFAGLVIGSYLLYTKVLVPAANKNSNLSKSDRVVAILSNSGSQGDYNGLMGLDDRFINDWYNAVKDKKATFTSGKDKFDTVTGHATR